MPLEIVLVILLNHHNFYQVFMFAGERIGYPLQYSWASLVAQLVKNPPAMWEIWVQSLGWGDPLEKGMVTHSRILACRIPWAV